MDVAESQDMAAKPYLSSNPWIRGKPTGIESDFVMPCLGQQPRRTGVYRRHMDNFSFNG